MISSRTVLSWVPGLLVAAAATAQPLFDLPRVSQSASVGQTIGVTQITLTYARPAVRDRVIWGGLVPYGAPWRAGGTL